jgi:hypothetical protein
MASMLPDEGEYLTTGWEPELEPADSLVRQAVLAHVSWARVIATAARGSAVDQPGWGAGRTNRGSPMLNWVVIKRPPTDFAAVLAEVAAWMADGGPYLVVCPFPTPDLSEFGVALLGHPPLMLRPTGDARAPETPLDVRRAASAEECAAAERVLIEGYPLPELDQLPPGDFYRRELLEGSTQVFVAYDGPTAVATAAAHSAAGITVVENVAALSAARGRGAGAAVTWAATRAWPDQPAMLIASDDGQPVYERLGYLRLVRWTVWMHPSRWVNFPARHVDFSPES